MASKRCECGQFPDVCERYGHADNGMVKTLYWDASDVRWVFIVKAGHLVRHHKLPRGIVNRADAEAASKDFGL